MTGTCAGCLFILLALTATGQTPQTPPEPGRDCAASGTVVNAITGEPIPNAMVTLEGSRGKGSATDAQGHWSVSDLPCESVSPRATHAEFLDGSYEAHGASDVKLVSGSPATDLKIALVPEGSISGRVQDANGDPIAHADVGVKQFAVSEGRRLLQGGAFTKSNGRGDFWIGGLRPGRYVVCADSQNLNYPVGGGPAELYLEDCFPSAGAASTTEVKGQNVQVSLTLRSRPALHVRGKVSGASDVRGIEVELAKSPGDPLRMRSADGRPRLMPFVHHAVSGPDGSFDIPGVPPGFYRAEALTPKGEVLFAEAEVRVGEADVDDVRLALAPMGALNGNVRFETSKSPSQAKPAPGVSLRLSFTANRAYNFADEQWDHLNFVIPQVPPGGYLLGISPDPGSGAWVKSATLRGQDVLNQPVWINGSTGPVEIVLTDAVSDVNITIKDANGNPVDSEIVMKAAAGSTIFVHADKGYVEKHGVPPDEYKVWAFDNITNVPWAEDEWMTQNAGPGQKVSVTMGTTASVTLTQAAAPPE